MSDNLETTLTNADVKLNVVDESEMLEGLAGDFFKDEIEDEVLPSDVVDNEVEEAAESDEAEAPETELDEDEEDDTEVESDEDDDQEADEVDEDSEELDMDYQVPIKINGEESTVSVSELIKGYQTAAFSNKKSIEASEQLKQAKTLADEATALKEQNSELLASRVDSDQAQLDAYDRKIQQLINDDDMFELPKWQEARRNKAKELKGNKVEATRLKDEAEAETSKATQAQITASREIAIEALDRSLPGWQSRYEEVVNWAVKDLGFPEFANIVDAKTIELMYDYKSLKDGVKSASKKRKKAPTKTVKASKPVNKKAKTNEKANELRKRVLKGEASGNQNDSFLDSMVNGLLD
mgnify:CR=1 FL=1